MTANRLKPFVIAAAMIAAAIASSATARDDRQGDRGMRGESRFEHRGDRGPDHRPDRDRPRYPQQGNYGSISIVPGLGTFSGSLDVFRQRGNGIYFTRDYAPDREVAKPVVLAPKATILHVADELGSNNFSADTGCSYESGVCVIRGK